MTLIIVFKDFGKILSAPVPLHGAINSILNPEQKFVKIPTMVIRCHRPAKLHIDIESRFEFYL
jgi:hypothetical protein